jgi:hypothetical protein
MQRVQRLYIEKLLGTPLYDKIIGDIKEGTLGGVYQALLEKYILPVYIGYVEYRVTTHVAIQIRNKNLGRSGDADITPATLNEYNVLREELIRDAKSYEDKLIKHLCDDNGEKYPEYIVRTGNAEDLKPQRKTAYSKTIFLTNSTYSQKYPKYE